MNLYSKEKQTKYIIKSKLHSLFLDISFEQT